MRTAEAIRTKNTWLQLSPNNYTNLHTKIVASYKEHVFLSKIKKHATIIGAKMQNIHLYNYLATTLYHRVCKISRKNGRAMHAPTNTPINKIVVGATIGRPYQILSQYQNYLPTLFANVI